MPVGSEEMKGEFRKYREAPRRGYHAGVRMLGALMDGKEFPGMRGIAGLLPMRKVVREAKEFIFRRAELHGCRIGNAEHFERIVVDAAFHIFVDYAADLDLTVDALKFRRIIIIRQVPNGDFKADQLGFIVPVLIELCFELGVIFTFHHTYSQPVAEPVEQNHQKKESSADRPHSQGELV